FRFKCVSCNQWHEGMPTFGANAPYHFYEVAPEERAKRCDLGSNACVIDGMFFFVRGCLEFPCSVRRTAFHGAFGFRSAKIASISSSATLTNRSGRILAPSSAGFLPPCRFIRILSVSRPAYIFET